VQARPFERNVNARGGCARIEPSDPRAELELASAQEKVRLRAERFSDDDFELGTAGSDDPDLLRTHTHDDA
jgi:hypothetical protein